VQSIPYWTQDLCDGPGGDVGAKVTQTVCSRGHVGEAEERREAYLLAQAAANLCALEEVFSWPIMRSSILTTDGR